MRRLILVSGLLVVAFLAAPDAQADQRSGKGEGVRHGSVTDVRGGQGQRFAPGQGHRAGPRRAWYYQPGRGGHFVPWPQTPRHGFVPRPNHQQRPKVATFVPLPAVLGRLRPHYPTIGRASRHSECYVISARDHFGRPLLITVDARSGHILERKFVRW